MKPRPSRTSDDQRQLTGSTMSTSTDIIASEQDIELTAEASTSSRCPSTLTTKNIIVVGVLVTINLLNYMDRFTIAGLLDKVEKFYDLSFSEVGLLQTAFIISYMLLSPVFGYLGDRYSRKYIIIFGVSLWSFITLASSFIPSHLYGVFLAMRALVGIGEASYCTVAPTILSDMFAKDTRTKVLALFFFATPVGSGLGYIVGSFVYTLFGNWQIALRVTPILGLACVVLTFFFIQDPPRGSADHIPSQVLASTSWFDDVRLLICKSPSYLFTSLGFTTVAFTTGALTWWAVLFINYAINYRYNDPKAAAEYQVSLSFGVITCLAGIVGVLMGVVLARHMRQKTPRADPYVCAFGMLCSVPFLLVCLIVSRYSYAVALVFVFFAELFLCLNWALVTDISMSVVAPHRRSTASAIQMLLSHAFGDAGSPYLVGLISDIIKANSKSPPLVADFNSLQYALFITPFVCVLGGGFFLACSFYIVRDKMELESFMKTSELEVSQSSMGQSSTSASPSTEDMRNFATDVVS